MSSVYKKNMLIRVAKGMYAHTYGNKINCTFTLPFMLFHKTMMDFHAMYTANNYSFTTIIQIDEQHKLVT